MPSRISLVRTEYYANPRNSFWWIMSQLLGFDNKLAYAQKAEIIIGNEIAIWDVLFDCERSGSLDSAIVRQSEVVNDFKSFFSDHPELRRVIFNGAAAQKMFARHCSSLLIDYAGRVSYRRCPSTSPAHAAMNAQQKLDAWRQAIKP